VNLIKINRETYEKIVRLSQSTSDACYTASSECTTDNRGQIIELSITIDIETMNDAMIKLLAKMNIQAESFFYQPG
jgi:hypothetical protein